VEIEKRGKTFSLPVHGGSKAGLPRDNLVVVLLPRPRGRAKRLRPGTNSVYVLLREPRFFVHQPVGERRHPFFLDFFTNQGEVLGCLLWIFLRLPILKVDMAASHVHVVND
jgi:hypothetical protein